MRSREKREGRRSEQPSLLFNDTMNDRPLPKPPGMAQGASWRDRRGYSKGREKESRRMDGSYYEEGEMSYYNDERRQREKTKRRSPDTKSLAEILEDGMRKMNFKMDEVGLKVDGLARRVAKVEQKMEEFSQKVYITS